MCNGETFYSIDQFQHVHDLHDLSYVSYLQFLSRHYGFTYYGHGNQCSELGLLRPPDFFNRLTVRKKTG